MESRMLFQVLGEAGEADLLIDESENAITVGRGLGSSMDWVG